MKGSPCREPIAMTVEARHCPPTDALVAAASPDADRATRERVADHVVGCPRCAEELRVIRALRPWAQQNAALVSGTAALQDAPVKSRWPGMGWAYAAAALFAVAAAAQTLRIVELRQANRSLTARLQV